MHKKMILYFIVILIASVCIITVFEQKNNNASSVYAIQSYSNNNVFILRINRKHQQIDLYRKQNKDSLLRYHISENAISKEISINNCWEVQTTAELDHSPFLLADEARLLLLGKSDNTSNIKEYLDLLLTALSTAYTDSDIIIDYNALPIAVEQLTALVKNKNARKAMQFNKRFSKANVIYSISPFSDAYMTEQIVEIISSVVQQEHRTEIHEALLQSCNKLSDYSLKISENLTGTFKGFEIYNNQNIIFSVNKLK